MRAQPAGDRQDDGVGGKVAGENPFAVIDRGRQAAGDVAQRHHRDGGIEHLHERRHHDDGGHQPRVSRRTEIWRAKVPRRSFAERPASALSERWWLAIEGS